MSYQIVFRPEAETELQDALDWYEERASSLGRGFLDRVDDAIERIAAFPRSAPVIHRDIRRQRLERFPHSIFYITEADRIVVLAVFHGRRDPASWKDRR